MLICIQSGIREENESYMVERDPGCNGKEKNGRRTVDG
jgi:hypothetical protein